MNKKDLLEKLLALANDKCNRFVSEAAYAKYLELKSKYSEEVTVEEVNKEWNAYDTSTWSKEDQDAYNYWTGGKFSFERTTEFLEEVVKVEGGYLVRRLGYLRAMSYHFQRQLESFGYEYEGVRKHCLKQINFFEQLIHDEFGDDECDQPWYTDSWGKFTIKVAQGLDSKKTGSPKINYLMFVEDDLVDLIKSHWKKGTFEDAKREE